MRHALIIAATMITASAQAQAWRYAQPHPSEGLRGAPFPHFAPGRPGGYALPFFRQAPVAPYYAPPQAPAFAPAWRPPAYAAAPRPSPHFVAPVAPRAEVAPVMPPVPVIPIAPPVPVMPVPAVPFAAAAPLAAPVLRTAPAAPEVLVTPTARVVPAMTQTLNAREAEPASPAGLLSGLPLKLLVPVAGIGALAWFGRRRMKGAGPSKAVNDYAELPY